MICISWKDIIKFERNPYSDGKSYVRQIERIAEDIEKVIELLRRHPDSSPTAIDMLEKIDTKV